MTSPVPSSPMISKCLLGVMACAKKCATECGTADCCDGQCQSFHCQMVHMYSARGTIEKNIANKKKKWLVDLCDAFVHLSSERMDLRGRKLERILSQSPPVVDQFDVGACRALCDSMIDYYVKNSCLTPEQCKAHDELVSKATTIIGQIVKALE